MEAVGGADEKVLLRRSPDRRRTARERYAERQAGVSLQRRDDVGVLAELTLEVAGAAHARIEAEIQAALWRAQGGQGQRRSPCRGLAVVARLTIRPVVDRCRREKPVSETRPVNTESVSGLPPPKHRHSEAAMMLLSRRLIDT